MKKRMSLHEKAFAAMKKAVKKVIEEHKESGQPLIVWRKGRIVRIPAKDL